jgi:hypothetical protein
MSTMPKLSGRTSLAGPKGQPQPEPGARRNNSVAAESQLALGNQAILQGLASGTEISGVRHPLRPILGNQGTVLRLQTKLRVNTPGDQHEQEADRVAERVMRIPTNGSAVGLGATSTAAGVQRKCSCSGSGSKCSQCQEDEPMVQRAAASPTAPRHAPPIVNQALQGPGGPLDASTRAFMEPRFGQDFSDVRIHADGPSGDAADAIDAVAYTVGRDVVFAHGTYQPSSDRGRKLLAHELTHVVQQRRGAPAMVQRDINSLRDPPTQRQTGNPLLLGLPRLAPELTRQFAVRAMPENVFQALTGIRVKSIPEKQLLSPEDAGLVADPGLLAGAGAGVLFGPRPTLPLPIGSTGVLWSGDAHLSQFAVVPQENPALSFFFGDAALEAYGFRSALPIHIGSKFERSVPGKPSTPLTNLLNRGLPGNYVSDPVFPYLGSVAVYPQKGAETIPGAQQLVACMQEANRSGNLKGTYRFSTPSRNSPAFDRAFGKGAAADPGFQAPEIVNCLNKANALTQQALQGRDLVVKIEGRDINISTGTDVATGQPVPNTLPSAASNVRDYLGQSDADFAAQGLSRTPITAAIWLRGVTGVLRIGGFILTITNLARIADRYQTASDYDKPLVAGEEATILTAGLLGSLIGEAIGEVVLCTGTGPGFGLCVLAAGVAGGVGGSSLAEDTAHSVGKTLQDAAELNRRGQLVPGLLDATTRMLHMEEERKKLRSRAPEKRDECVFPFCIDF